jgi:hypothetical protein
MTPLCVRSTDAVSRRRQPMPSAAAFAFELLEHVYQLPPEKHKAIGRLTATPLRDRACHRRFVAMP